MSRWWFQTTTTFVVVLCLQSCTAKNFSAFFIFGDSIADVGNNNYINGTLARANFEPVGIDFGKPTGRFSNGRIVFDIIGQSLGFKDFIPPYLAPSTVGPVILHGVNYASGAGGILNETGAIFGGRISMDAQIHYFAKTRVDIISRIGVPAADKLFATALFSVTMGANDLLSNYLLDVSNNTKKPVPPEKLIEIVISTFRRQLTKLYDLGARKICVGNVPPIGCCPNQMDSHPSLGQECVAFENLLAQQYNRQLKRLLLELNTALKGSTFVYIDTYHIFEDIRQNYRSYGFESVDVACCGEVGLHRGIVLCLPHSRVCPDRSKYVFWDPFHVTEAANLIIANRALEGNSSYISPFNLRELSQI